MTSQMPAITAKKLSAVTCAVLLAAVMITMTAAESACAAEAAKTSAVKSADFQNLRPVAAGMKVSLSASAQKMIANDEARVYWKAMSQKKTAAEASRTALAAAEKGVAVIKKAFPGIVVNTGSVSVDPVYTRAKEGESSKIDSWRATVRLNARAPQAGKAGELSVAPLSAGSADWTIESVRFSVSKAVLAKANDALVQDVVKQIQQKGIRVAQGFGMSPNSARMESVNFSDPEGGSPRVMMMSTARMMSAGANSATPSLEAGETEVSVQASAVVVIRQ